MDTVLPTTGDLTDIDDDFSDPVATGYQDRLAAVRDERGIARVLYGGRVATMESPPIVGVVLRGPKTLRIAWNA